MASKAARSIKSAHRVLEILEYFDMNHRTATVMDLSRSLAYPQSSTSELLRCLTRLGYLHYNRVRRTYTPTARVALLGSWVEPTLFRGGTVMTALDHMVETVGETVALSTAVNYVVQHLHVVTGRGEDAIPEQAGNTEPLLHSPQGRLLLATYQDLQIRSALHRLNAEEPNPERRVKVNETIDEFGRIRKRGWLIDAQAKPEEGIGVVAVLLPPRKGRDRLALSVMARSEVIEQRGEEILQVMLEERDHILPHQDDRPADRTSGMGTPQAAVPMSRAPQPLHA
jgi:DNA-binding IclR family transcriptional regulator